jgi:hypothetical protein
MANVNNKCLNDIFCKLINPLQYHFKASKHEIVF